MNTTTLLIEAAAIVVGYAFIASRMLVIGSHFRKRALDLGTELLDDSRVPSDVKMAIENWLCDIPHTSFAWLLNILIIPAIIIVVVRRWNGMPISKEGMPSPSAPYWKTWDDFTTMAIIATLCNSPITFTLFMLQIVFGVSFVHGNHVIWVTVNRLAHQNIFGGWFHRHA